MSVLKHPSLLIDLGRAGENGLPWSNDPTLQVEAEICRRWGFRLNAAGGRVRLDFDQEQLVPEWIRMEAPDLAGERLCVEGFLRLDSTNEEALRQARQGAPAGTLIVAEEQTAGRGRKGRVWHSPAGAGLYFSLILRPGKPRRAWPLLTHAASVALAETLGGLSAGLPVRRPLEVDLKWPNDVLLSGRKCAGILLETGRVDDMRPAAVVGVGVNVHAGSVPSMSAREAACLDEMAEAAIPRRRVLVGFLRRFDHWYGIFECGNHRELLARWKSLCSMWDGTPVWIMEGAKRRAVVTCGLDDNGALMVRTAEGKVETVLAGDIRLRRAAE